MSDITKATRAKSKTYTFSIEPPESREEITGAIYKFFFVSRKRSTISASFFAVTYFIRDVLGMSDDPFALLAQQIKPHYSYRDIVITTEAHLETIINSKEGFGTIILLRDLNNLNNIEVL